MGSSRTRKRVYVHVGSPKTGTTFLQNVLWAQRDLARAQGLLLPMERFSDHYLATLDVRGIADRPPHPPHAIGMWNRIVEEAVRWPGNVLISHELFAGANREQAQRALARLVDRAEVHVVITARDLVRQVTAEWQEHVKHRSDKSLGEFLDELRGDTDRTSWFWLVQDFAELADRWGGGLPASHVHVVTVPPAGAAPGLLWERFARLLDLEPGAFDTKQARANTSLGLEQTELLRRVNIALGDRLPVPGPYAPVVKDLLAHRLLSGRKGRSLMLAASDVDWAVEQSQQITERLGRIGVDVVGDLADLVPIVDDLDVRAGQEAYEPPPAEVLLDESVAALADLLVELSDRRVAQRNRQERLEFAERSPVKFALVRASERHPAVMKARDAYRRRNSPGESR